MAERKKSENTEPSLSSEMDAKEFKHLLRQSSVGRGESEGDYARRISAERLDPFRRELNELLALEVPEPSQLRRIAEVTEIVHGDDEARQWWVKAAAAGDRDAKDYLTVLIEEEED